MAVSNRTIVSLGELLIDFVPQTNGLPLSQVEGFQRAAGGAPANVAAAVAKLGGKSRFIGKVGRDAFGEYLRGTLEAVGVEAALIETDEARTCLAFVSLRADGERDFLFYREPSADILLRAGEIREEWIRDAAVFHFGSVSLANEPCRTATLETARRAREHGALISFDPNVRLPLWPGEERAKREILEAMPLADVVKVSEEEAVFLSGKDVHAGARQLLEYGPRIIVVTMGAQGCRVVTRRADFHVPGIRVRAVDTTGAGDAFVGGMLYRLAALHLQAAEIEDRCSDGEFAKDVFRFANCVGALATTGRGAIPSLPAMAEVEKVLEQ
mgnify:CR=1 FL=1